MPLMELRDIGVSFDSRTVLQQVNFKVNAGDVVAILGENGSGKSTLLRAATGLISPSAGSAHLFGVPVSARSKVPWGKLGYVPQRILAPAGMPATASEVVRTGLLSSPWLRNPRAGSAVTRALAAVGLQHRAKDAVSTFSGGQAQRVAIARALVRDPELLVLDEPTAGVDEKRKQQLATLLGDLAGEGRAVVIVLHDLGPFADIITRTVTIEEGTIAHECVVIDGIPVHVDDADDAFHEISHHDEAFDEAADSQFASADNPMGW